MELLIGALALSALALALAGILALFEDTFALRIASIILARREARLAYRAKYAAALAERETEFELQPLRWGRTAE